MIQSKMEQIPNYGDDRNKGWCVHCGGATESRDHVPSRILLDVPVPENLPVVPSCIVCNTSCSSDEEYVACLIECAKTGSIEEAQAQRPKIRKVLARQQALASRLAAARQECADGVIWMPEMNRVSSVILKLARGHAAYEENEPQLDEPEEILIRPLCVFSESERQQFEERGSGVQAWPEVGSRAMSRILVARTEGFGGWIHVQDDRYRYRVEPGGKHVRIVIGEYLAAEVLWE